MADTEPDPPLLPLAEAAAKTGRHPEALRAMARRGRLKTVRGNDGRLLVELPAGQEPAAAGERPAAAAAMTGQQPDLAGQVAELEAAMAELREELLAARLTAGRAEAERDAARAIAAAETAALRELVVELRAELAAARRPWWRRWLG